MPDISPAAVQAAAEVMLRQYESQYEAGHLTWRDFADDARAILVAARDAEAVLPTVAQIWAWLEAREWTSRRPGYAGALWSPPNGSRAVAVPHDDRDPEMTMGALKRIAERTGYQPLAELIAEMRDPDA